MRNQINLKVKAKVKLPKKPINQLLKQIKSKNLLKKLNQKNKQKDKNRKNQQMINLKYLQFYHKPRNKLILKQ